MNFTESYVYEPNLIQFNTLRLAWLAPASSDAEVEAPILWPPDAKSRLIGKEPNAGKD